MAQIQVRIDDVLKHQAQEVLEKLGLSLSTAIKMMCSQIVQLQALPLQSRTVDGVSLERIQHLEESSLEIEEDIKTGKVKGYTDMNKMMADIISEK